MSAAVAGAMVVALVPTLGAAPAGADPGDLIISEVWPGGSSNGTYAADWFEITNTGATAVDLTGWKVDDSSASFASAVALSGVTSIDPGQSVVFVEGTSTQAAALTTAWFGASPPSGFTVGTYSGSGIGLGSGGDAVNLYDSVGTLITNVSFGAAGTATTFDNAAGAVGAISTLSVVGTNGAFVSDTGSETGSPGTIANAPAGVTDVDLSSYVRVGRYNLPEPTRTTPPDGINLLAQEASGVTYNPVTDTLFVIGDGGTSVTQVSKTGAFIDTMTLAAGSSPQGTEFYDPEGITYVGGGDQFVMVEERDRQVSLFTYVPGTTLTRSAVQTVDLGTFEDNTGLEGLTYDPLTGGYIPVKEISPLGIFQTDVDFGAGTASNGSPTTVNSTNLFDPALTGMTDFADVYALSNIPSLAGEPQQANLLVLSQEDGRIINVDRSGVIDSTLTIVSDPGNPLSVPNQQHEGLTMDHDGNLYVVSENGGGDIDHPQLWVYSPSAVPNQAPTAVTLTNQTTSLAENTNTVTRLKVADVAITDDGLGMNGLAVVGADAASFEVDSNGLYIVAGTTLDYETKASYTVSVTVDDTSVGSTPDATSAPYTLTLTDVVDESTTLPNLVISEVSPWSSGSAPYGADWFEVTNNGDEAVDLTGYRFDDNSNAFASSVELVGVSSLEPGASAVFVEGTGTTTAAFITAWFGASAPSGFTIGSYSGGGVGLSTGGDSVNLFDPSGARVTGVSFGVSTTGQTFDNTAGVGSTTLPLPAVTILSVDGVNGAFVADDAIEVGSPGSKATTLVVSEVSPWSSGGTTYAADWFEITNTGAGPVGVSGWKMDDNSNSPVGAVALNDVTAIGAGESVVFVEGTATTAAALTAAWFGPAVPVGLQVGFYGGSGVGLSSGGDGVNLFDASGTRVTGVSFGASTTGFTFDNAAGVAGAISTLSVAGVNGAFVAVDGSGTGSPGRIAGSPVTRIAGTVVDEATTGPIAGVNVWLYNPANTVVATTTTDGAGMYSVDVLAGVDYKVRFVGNATYGGEYHANATNLVGATPVNVLLDSTATVDAALTPKAQLASVAGTITDGVSGAPVPGMKVTLYRNGAVVRVLTSDTAGQFATAGLDPTGTWTARYWDPSGVVYATSWFDERPTQWTADTFTMTGGTTTDLSTRMWQQADTVTVGGTITDIDTTAPLGGIEVKLFSNDKVAATAVTQPDGSYAFTGVLPGTYKVRASSTDGSYRTGWWVNRNSLAAADPLVVVVDNLAVDIALRSLAV